MYNAKEKRTKVTYLDDIIRLNNMIIKFFKASFITAILSDRRHCVFSITTYLPRRCCGFLLPTLTKESWYRAVRASLAEKSNGHGSEDMPGGLMGVEGFGSRFWNLQYFP